MTVAQHFPVSCSNHLSVLVMVATRQIEAALAQQSIDDLRPIQVLVPSAAMRDRQCDDLEAWDSRRLALANQTTETMI
jgi:hypothetical protein